MPKNEHMCPKDFFSNRNISNIFEEASPPRDKLDFGEPQASGILSPSGRHTHSEWWSATRVSVAGGTTRTTQKDTGTPTQVGVTESDAIY